MDFRLEDERSVSTLRHHSGAQLTITFFFPHCGQHFSMIHRSLTKTILVKLFLFFLFVPCPFQDTLSWSKECLWIKAVFRKYWSVSPHRQLHADECGLQLLTYVLVFSWTLAIDLIINSITFYVCLHCPQLQTSNRNTPLGPVTLTTAVKQNDVVSLANSTAGASFDPILAVSSFRWHLQACNWRRRAIIFPRFSVFTGVHLFLVWQPGMEESYNKFGGFSVLPI